jgi:hypothetical protein
MQTKAKINFIDFIRPDGYWPSPYSVDQAFGVMRWMVATGSAMPELADERGQWGTSTVINLLNCSPTCVNSHAPLSITNVAALRKSFHYALLSRYESRRVKRWKEKHGVSHTSTKILDFPNEGIQGAADGAGVSAERVDQLTLCKRRLTTQLNSCHAAATELYGVTINIDANSHGGTYYPPGGRFRFTVDYGFDGSIWHHDIAIGTPAETFSQTLKRAEIELDKLTGADKWPDPAKLSEGLSVDQKRACVATVEHNGMTYTIKWGQWRDNFYGNHWHIVKAEPEPKDTTTK